MGWRPGQGIGPKASKAVLQRDKAREAKAVYGKNSSRWDEGQAKEVEEMAPGFLFAPDDINPPEFDQKHDVHGLGYKGLESSSVLNQKYAQKGLAVTSSNAKTAKSIRGQAFGVGAFEEDDDDIYCAQDLSQYDYALGGAGSSSYERTYTNVSEDFQPAKAPLSARRFFPSPKLHRDYKPKPVIAKGSEEVSEELKTLSKRLNPIQRARLLGENHSIMILLKDDDRRRLQQTKKTPFKPSEEPKIKREPILKPEVKTEPDSIPFPNEIHKQRRYMQYVSYLKRGLNLPQPVELTEWEWESEVKEFREHLPEELRQLLPEIHAKTKPLAKPEIARPFAHLLKSKFTHASHTVDDVKQGAEDEDKTQAVKMKMFGKLTRETHEWHPDKQLCKRFNLPDPYPESMIAGVPHLQKASASSAGREVFMLGMEMLPSTAQELANKAEEDSVKSQPLYKPVKGEPEQAALLERSGVSAVDCAQTPESVTTNAVPTEDERPPIDLFKAIFLDSESEQEEAEESSDADKNDNKTPEKPIEPQPSTSTSEVRTVRAPLFPSFEDAAKRIRKSSSSGSDSDKLLRTKSISTSDKKLEMSADEKEVDLFGPALPPLNGDYQARLPSTSVVRKEKRKSKKTKHKHHKSKKSFSSSSHSKKKKKKTKKRKERSSSESSSSDSDIEIIHESQYKRRDNRR